MCGELKAMREEGAAAGIMGQQWKLVLSLPVMEAKIKMISKAYSISDC